MMSVLTVSYAFASSWYASELLIIDITNSGTPHVLETVGGFYWEWVYLLSVRRRQ